MWRTTHFPNGMPQAADPVLKRVPMDLDSLNYTVGVVEWARFCSHASGCAACSLAQSTGHRGGHQYSVWRAHVSL